MSARAPDIVFTDESWRALQEVSEAAYPFEGCGLLLGPFGREKVVFRVAGLRNVLRDEGRGRFDFSLSPQEFATAQLQAERDDLDVLGIYHTHPDHPPRPSATDAGQPMLAGWINVIAAVHGGRFKGAKAWWREDESHAFVETKLSVRPAV